MRWFAEFFAAPKNQIKVGLYLYENMDIGEEKAFWRNELVLDDDRFYKPRLTRLKESSFSYRESYRHCTCTVYVYGEERYRQIMMGIRAFFDIGENRK